MCSLMGSEVQDKIKVFAGGRANQYIPQPVPFPSLSPPPRGERVTRWALTGDSIVLIAGHD